jgi:hypothetical protein
MAEAARDQEARDMAHAAKAEIDAHKAVCEVHYSEHAAAFKRNDSAHEQMHSKVEAIKFSLLSVHDELHAQDKRAIYRWISFGGTVLALIAAALFGGFLKQ